MSPTPNVVPFDVARLAVDVENIRGEQALLSATVGQHIQTLTVLVQGIQHEQERAREDRIQQIGLLQSLTATATAGAGSAGRVHELELKVSRWVGVVVGFGAAVFMVFALIVYAYQGDKGMILKNVDINSAAIRALQDRRP